MKKILIRLCICFVGITAVVLMVPKAHASGKAVEQAALYSSMAHRCHGVSKASAEQADIDGLIKHGDAFISAFKKMDKITLNIRAKAPIRFYKLCKDLFK